MEEEEKTAMEEEDKTTEKKTAGRQTVPLVKIEWPEDRYATFSERRSGLYKKSSKVVGECGIDIGIALFSLAGNPFSFFHPTPNLILDHVKNPNIELSKSTKFVVVYAPNNVNQTNNRINENETIEKAAKSQMFLLEQLNKTRQIDLWECIDQFNANDITKCEAWLKGIIFGLENRLKQLEKRASSSSQALLDNAHNSSSASNE
ncbi:agamous-like MADS-box protein AGL61 [Nicotiana tomentosiformis]|uniref:agamous-like MADS-box protein AGL61 n=1 Tax=Nicotiana tomentosiformis TaxID=4098 RepID=UPI00051B0DAF|nr:agamous-like MADS-box protein AGL61 [Nicotiana tomentosiformis]